MEVTNAALERKKRFRAIKEKANGDISAVRRDVMFRPYRLYFDKSGTIVAFTQDENVQVREGWFTHAFTQDQLEILKGKNTAKYVIVQDPKESNVFSIEARKIESYVVNAANTFLYHVYENNPSADLECVFNGEQLTLTLSDTVKSEYAEIEPALARINNRHILYFYLTAPNDPHILFHEIVLEFAELLTNNSVTIDLDDDYTGCGLYTKKTFTTYSLGAE